MDIYKLKWTPVQSSIISLMCARAGERLSQREIALILKVSPTAVGNSISELKAKRFIRVDKLKTINLISFNRDEKLAVELKRVENLKAFYLSGLSDYLEKELPGGTIILFGSYSFGEDTCTSDIDIAVISRKDKVLDLQRFEHVLRRKINLNFFDSWTDIPKNLKNNILNGIVIKGSVDL